MAPERCRDVAHVAAGTHKRAIQQTFFRYGCPDE